MVCASVVSAACDQRDVRVVWVGTVETLMCAGCRAVADALGLPLRPLVSARVPDRRRNRYAMAGEGIERRTADVEVPMA
jgi:hypothetical protein